jgi:Cu/Ag efflux protein CusF
MENRQTALKILVMAAVLAVSTAALAGQAKLHTMTGEVVKIDATMKTVTVKGMVGKKEKEVAMQLAPDASFTRHDQKIGLDTLKAGDRVIVHFASVKGTRTAHSIALQDPAAQPTGYGK